MLYLLTVVCLLIIIWLLQSQFYRLKPSKKIPEEIKTKLIELGRKSLKTNDVPIGAVLVHNNIIIGEGYNTIQKNKHLSGHAELNALDMGFDTLGNRFFGMNKKNLVLYTTYEPCEMCKGALVHYNIRNVYFEAKKPILTQVKATLKELFYEVSKKKLKGNNLQYKLFLQHPDFDKKSRF